VKILTNHKSLLPDLVSAFMVFLLVYTGTSKFKHLPVFNSQLRETKLYNGVEQLLTWTIPFAEILVAILLIVPSTRKLGLLLSAVLLSFFTVHLLLVIVSSGPIPCSCGGIFNGLTWIQHLVLNAVLLALCYTSYFIARRIPGSTEIKPSRPTHY
jgi:uncharacterized membrane protein YphA (DoxX/SURF4 family)